MHVFAFLFRSLLNGNCLYSSALICLFGHNNHLNELRWLISTELYENASFYCQHPVLLECLKVHSNAYSNFNSIFSCCLSQKSFNSFASTDIVKSVKDEAVYNLKNGEYCSFLCILALSTIYHEVPNGNTMTKNLYSEPLTGFSKNAHKRLADHQNKTGTIHQKAMPIYDSFMKIMKGKMLAVKDQVQLKPDQVIFNQTDLKTIIEAITFYGRQALSLRGHRDDPQFYNSSLLEFTSVNVGNFLELIRFRVAAGDGILKRHILKAPSNAKYMSKTIQNELICLCGEEIVTGIISEVKESRVFSILADEVRDCSTLNKCNLLIDL